MPRPAGRKPILATLSALALCATAGVGTATAAVPMDGTPGCVSSWVYEGTLTDTAYVRNATCNSTKYVRVVWAFGADSVCIELRPGQQRSNTVPAYPRRFEGHKPC